MKRCIVLSNRCPHCLSYYFEVADVNRRGNVLHYLLYCLKCRKMVEADELSVLATPTLQYPNMSGGFSERGDPAVIIANGWEEWNTHHTFWSGTVKRAESKPDYGTFYAGNASQGMAHVQCLWRGGIFQQLQVIPGHRYEFSMMARVWTKAGGKTHARVGINPWGAGPYHYTSVPGKEVLPDQFGEWVRVSVDTIAFTDKVTVYAENLVELMIDTVVWWDMAEFKEIELGTTPDPQPQPEPGECGFVNRWQEVIDNQAELLQALATVPKRDEVLKWD